ncbi:MAG: glycosyltransferase family 2 protein [Bacteroidetes bacterium]|nr:glycosyltransferase family 2 protein [Bacteroidota bacterium]
MKIAGFTFIRNAVKYDYPIVEAIKSIVPLCDEVIVSVGNSADETEDLIRSISSPKVKIYHSTWNDELREGGFVLAEETDKAFDHVPPDVDWCIYIQGDEVIHEKYYPAILEAMEKYKDDFRVEGLLFKYLHFYASYDYVGDSRKWYDHEIRIIRNDKSIRSYRDAQGFRKNGEKLRVKEIDAYIYHYGWVKHPSYQQQKINDFGKLWRNDHEIANQNIVKGDQSQYDYSEIDSLEFFKGTHPSVMKDRVNRKNWTFDFDITRKKFSLSKRFLYWFERKTGKRLFNYENYKKI